MFSEKPKIGLVILILSFLPLLAGSTYFLYLDLVFPQLVPHHGSGERFTLNKVENGTYTFQIPWSAYTRLHLTLQANSTVELYVNGTYVCDCTHHDLVIEQHGRALILLRSDSPASGMFEAWQEIPSERRMFAIGLLLVGFIGVGIGISIRIQRQKERSHV